MIAESRLAPGTPIRQEAIARELGTSRLPVREALRQLESEGLVVYRPNSGARVAILDFDECVEIYKIRERLEPLAISEAIRTLTDEEIERAAILARDLEEMTTDSDRWLAGDRQFHLACYEGLTTRRLIQMIEHFWNTTQRYRRLLLTTFSETDFGVATAEHRMIVDALRSRNARAAEDLVRVAIERSRLRLEGRRDLFDESQLRSRKGQEPDGRKAIVIDVNEVGPGRAR
jgi:DNA-binding GntR family transcriptional regulator